MVTFRLRDAGATNVTVSLESVSNAVPMIKDAQGVWSATLGLLPPDVYAYGFSVDGLRTLDPANPDVQPRRSLTASLFEVPAAVPQYYDFQPVPHGVIRLEHYQSKSLGRMRTLLVYTPPGYDQHPRARYPVLYLLHGYGDNEATWTGAGRAPWIADNLLAAGKATPMIIVMPDGHAVVPPESGRDPQATLRNLLAFEDDFLHDAMPFVETNYRTQADPEHRAVIGPSMGGRQSLTIGLQNPNLFAWTGGMSASLPTPELTLTNLLKNPAGANGRLKFVWFCCGQSDPLLPKVRDMDGLLNGHGIRHQYHEYPGGHGWPVWRPALADFLELLFKPQSAGPGLRK